MTTDSLEPHPIVRLLGKPMADVTADDLVRVVTELGLHQVDLRYVGGDGRLKSIAFAVRSDQHLREVLVRGERVDGSSIFEGADTEASDVYVVPRHRTAFVNPFGERPSLDLLCSFYDEQGEPLAHAPDQVVRRAAEVLTAQTGMTLEAFGELEYYLVDELDDLFEIEEERGYQESAPFSKGRRIREQVLGHLASMGVLVKYGHGEVGNTREHDRQLVQHEIELWPVPVEQAADALVIAKWVVREVAHANGMEATFAPSVSDNGAGNGLHIHSRLVADGRNVIVDEEGLTDTGRRLVAGYLTAAKALTAFGNTVSTSYLRLADGEESPEGICWGETDRTGLVRVPLAWVGDVLPAMVAHANPGHHEPIPVSPVHPQTVELRVADGSADVQLLLAGMAVAARRGLTANDSLEVAERLSTENGDDFEQLPTSCGESADALEAERGLFEAESVFPAGLIDHVVQTLRELEEAAPIEEVSGDDDARAELVRRHWHVG